MLFDAGLATLLMTPPRVLSSTNLSSSLILSFNGLMNFSMLTLFDPDSSVILLGTIRLSDLTEPDKAFEKSGKLS